MKKYLILFLSIICAISLSSCKGNSQTQLSIYNCGEYIDTDLVDEFEEEYNIKVNYVTFDSNETAVTKLKTEPFDVVIPSDYAIEQLTQLDLLQEIDWSKIEGFTQDMLTDEVKEILSDLKEGPNGFDFLKYAVPYFFGNVGICYDKNKVDLKDFEAGWEILHNPKYKNKVAYYDSARDGFMAAYKALGYSMNSTDKEETKEAFNWLKDIRKYTNCAFKTDELLSEMPDGKYAISLMYSGDAMYCMYENEDLDFYVPTDGTNVFVDGMVIPKNAKNTEMAYKFISFMCRYENAEKNSTYVGYSSCVNSVYDFFLNNPESEYYDFRDYYQVNYQENDEMFRYNSAQTVILNDYWIELKLS